jgi:hypothetical protein
MTESTSEVPSGNLNARLDAGPVICAEGFLFELERRGYLSAGEFVPEVALEYPTTATVRRCGSSARRTCSSR